MDTSITTFLDQWLKDDIQHNELSENILEAYKHVSIAAIPCLENNPSEGQKYNFSKALAQSMQLPIAEDDLKALIVLALAKAIAKSDKLRQNFYNAKPGISAKSSEYIASKLVEHAASITTDFLDKYRSVGLKKGNNPRTEYKKSNKPKNR